MSVTYQDALQKQAILNQFMDQVTPQLQQLGVDRSGYKGYAQAYQSAINNNLAIPQDFADIMYEYGGYGNTGQKLFYYDDDEKDSPRLTKEGIAYAGRSLPDADDHTKSMTLAREFHNFMNEADAYVKGKGDQTHYKGLKAMRDAAASHGMEIPQVIQDMSYAAGFGNTPVTKTQNVTNTQQNAPDFLDQFKKNLETQTESVSVPYAPSAPSAAPAAPVAPVAPTRISPVDNTPLPRLGSDWPADIYAEVIRNNSTESTPSFAAAPKLAQPELNSQRPSFNVSDFDEMLERFNNVVSSSKAAPYREIGFDPGRPTPDSSSLSYDVSRRGLSPLAPNFNFTFPALNNLL